MKRKKGLTLLAGFLFATVALSTAPSAQAAQCSLAGAAGKYGFTLTGTLLLPQGTVDRQFRLYGNGQLSGLRVGVGSFGSKDGVLVRFRGQSDRIFRD